MAAGAHVEALRPSGPPVWVVVDDHGTVVEASSGFADLSGIDGSPVELGARLAPPDRPVLDAVLAGDRDSAVLGGRRPDGVPFVVWLGATDLPAGSTGARLLVGARAGGPVGRAGAPGDAGTGPGAVDGRGIDHVLSHDLRGALRQATGFVTVTRRALLEEPAADVAPSDGIASDESGPAGHLGIALRSLANADAMGAAVVRWLRSGDLPLAVRPTPVAELVALARRGLDDRVRTDGAGARVATGSGGDLAVVVDAALAAEALVELLANAVVFWPGTEPVTVSAAAAADGWCEVSVVDGGPGIDDPVAALAPGRMLQPRGAYPGVGMGLPLAEVVARRHGGWLALRRVDDTTVAAIGLPVG